MLNKKILVTGGFGYLGNNLSRFLMDRGYDVRILSHHKPAYESKYLDRYDILIGDILEKDVLKKACKGMDFVLHLTGLNYRKCRENPELALMVNGIGTRNALEAAAYAKVRRFLYASTFHVYGKPKGNVDEETLPSPMSDYAITKLAGENYCRQFNDKMMCIVLRISNAYGPPLDHHERTLVMNDLCRQCVENQKIVLRTDGKQKRDFVAIHDIGHAISLLLNADPKKLGENVFNVGGSRLLSIMELAELISQTYLEERNKEVKIEFARPLTKEPAVDFEFDISRLKALGYKPQADMKREIVKIFKAFEGGSVG